MPERTFVFVASGNAFNDMSGSDSARNYDASHNIFDSNWTLQA